MFKLKWVLIIGGVIISLVSYSMSHSGRTDSSGGHHNRKTGGYHYHNRKKYTPPTQTQTWEEPIEIWEEPEKECEEPVRERLQRYPNPKKIPPKVWKPDTLIIPPKTNKITENHWQVALNNKLYRGKLEMDVGNGRADISTNTHIIEVDKASKYNEGMIQVLRYAEASGKTPVLALYVDGEKGGYSLLKQAETLCLEKNVQFLLINDYVSLNYINSLVNPADSDNSSRLDYWINTDSNIRHNKSCRWYESTENGRFCKKREGRACNICGG